MRDFAGCVRGSVLGLGLWALVGWVLTNLGIW